MKAIIKQDCGVLGFPMYQKGDIIDVSPLKSIYDEDVYGIDVNVPGYWVLTSGAIIKEEFLEIKE